MITRIVLAAAVAALAATAVVAQSDPIAARKALMKRNGAEARIAREMIDGKKPFDLAAVKKVFATFEEVSAKMPALFPDSSKTGDTKALPVIWEKKADFDAAFAKFGADAKAAAAKVTDLPSLKAAMGTLGKDCGGCHNTYRKKSS
jgi:cytochrome c556